MWFCHTFPSIFPSFHLFSTISISFCYSVHCSVQFRLVVDQIIASSSDAFDCYHKLGRWFHVYRSVDTYFWPDINKDIKRESVPFRYTWKVSLKHLCTNHRNSTKCTTAQNVQCAFPLNTKTPNPYISTSRGKVDIIYDKQCKLFYFVSHFFFGS